MALCSVFVIGNYLDTAFVSSDLAGMNTLLGLRIWKIAILREVFAIAFNSFRWNKIISWARKGFSDFNVTSTSVLSPPCLTLSIDFKIIEPSEQSLTKASAVSWQLSISSQLHFLIFGSVHYLLIKQNLSNTLWWNFLQHVCHLLHSNWKMWISSYNHVEHSIPSPFQ